jgi:hypothetical protein
MELSDTQLAYMAGLIDGEGSIESQRETQVRGATPRFVLRVSFVFATEEPLRTVCGWLGIAYKRYPTADLRRSDRYRAHIPKGIAVPLLAACLPYLIVKRRQAELILAIEAVRLAATPSRVHVGKASLQRMPTDAIDRMAALHLELRSLKSNKRRMDAPVNAT